MPPTCDLSRQSPSYLVHHYSEGAPDKMETLDIKDFVTNPLHWAMCTNSHFAEGAPVAVAQQNNRDREAGAN